MGSHRCDRSQHPSTFDVRLLTFSTASITDAQRSTPNAPLFGRPGSEMAGIGLLDSPSAPPTFGVREFPPSRPSADAEFAVPWCSEKGLPFYAAVRTHCCVGEYWEA